MTCDCCGQPLGQDWSEYTDATGTVRLCLECDNDGCKPAPASDDPGYVEGGNYQ